MVSLSIIERCDPAPSWLDHLMRYASVSDESHVSLLNALLVKACLRVQEMANKSILACTIELREDEVEDNTVKLYQTVSEVISVNAPAGHRMYWEHRGNGLRVYEDSVVVLYRTEPRPGDVDVLLPIVLQYATALYDGEDANTLANILKQCR